MADCPGCGTACGNDLCCDPCWTRLPTRLPGEGRPWRAQLKASRATRHTMGVARIHDAVETWLREHPTNR
jgi:hypothetical protein